MTSHFSKKDNSNKSRRIASNTLLLFIRMVAIMVINLYAVRVVLQALGKIDYGIFNTIAGIVLTSTFISSTLAISIQRFYSYTLGENQNSRLKDIFSASTNITIAISILVLFLFEGVGIWFIHTQLTIPPERLYAANWIFQFSIFAFILSLIQIPYTAAVFAHEDMGIYALISFLDCLGKLLVACLIGRFLIDNLIFYGAGILLVAFCIFCTYTIIGRKRYPECHYQAIESLEIYKELISFSGWTMYGTLAGVGMIQGTTILLNIFFGPLTNAAYAIANQIYNAANALCNTIIIAFRPAIIKSWASHNHEYLYQLFTVSNKSILFLLVTIAIPGIIEIRTVLYWWLNSVSEETITFARLFLIYLVCVALHNPITTIIQATGNIKTYYLWVESLTLMCLPITWFLLSMGLPSCYAFYSMIGMCILSHAVRLICLKRLFPLFSFKSYFVFFIIPGAFVIVLSCILSIWVHTNISSHPMQFWGVLFTSPLITMLLAYTIGLTNNERELLHGFILQIAKLKK